MTKLWPLLYHSPNTTGRLWWCLLCDHLRAIRRAHMTSQSSFRQAPTKYNFEILSILLSIKFTKLDKFYQYWHPWTYWQWDKDIWSPISLMYVIFITVNWRWSLVYIPICSVNLPHQVRGQRWAGCALWSPPPPAACRAREAQQTLIPGCL